MRFLAAVIWIFGFPAALSSQGMAAPPPSLEVYGALPKVEAVNLSPDGQMIAMVTTEGDKRMVVIQTADGKQSPAPTPES